MRIYCKIILAAILDYKFSTNGILLDFTMSFSIIFVYTLNKNELVTNLLNVYHVIHLMGDFQSAVHMLITRWRYG